MSLTAVATVPAPDDLQSAVVEVVVPVYNEEQILEARHLGGRGAVRG